MHKLSLLYFLLGLVSAPVLAQSMAIDVSLTPTGAFQIKSQDVRGSATVHGNAVEAKNIMVGLRNLKTGISLRDTHTKKHLQVDKYPDAILVVAKGHNGKGAALIKVMNIQKKVYGTYTIEGRTLHATFSLKISDFKIQDVRYMGVGVDDDVTVNVTVPIQN